MSKPHIAAVGSIFIDFIREEKEAVEGVGGRKLFSQQEFNHFLATHPGSPGQMGGSAFNTIRTMAHLVKQGLVSLHLSHCTLLGNDQKSLYLAATKELGITPHATYVDEETGKVLSWITRKENEIERTMRVVAGSSKNPIPLNTKELEKASLIHLDGYTLFMEKVIDYPFPAPLSLDLGSFEVIEENKERLFSLLHRKKLTYLFGNEKEVNQILSLQGYPKSAQTPENGCLYLRQFCRGVVITQGSHGLFYSIDAPTIHHVKAFPVDPKAILDPTGAGDQCNGTFLAFLLTGHPPQTAAKMACRIAAEGIQCLGSNFSDPHRWHAIQEYFHREFPI